MCVLQPRQRKGPAGRKFSDLERDSRIAELFFSGLTSAEIAPAFNLTPGGVNDILRRNGIGRSMGGKAAAARNRKIAKAQAQKDARALEIELSFGCPLHLFESSEQRAEAHQRFKEQKGRAAQRNIDWRLTFFDWWQAWRDSGKWAARGRSHAESAVMARKGDTGPYSPENVYITTLAKNFVESHFVRGHRIRSELTVPPL